MMLRKLRHSAKIALTRRLLFLAPSQHYQVFSGEHSSIQLCRHMAAAGAQHVLLVTDRPLMDLGIAPSVAAALQAADVRVSFYDAVLPDPTLSIAMAGCDLFNASACDTLLAVGGGSSIDTAKMIAVIASHSDDLTAVMGIGKLSNPLPPVYAVPTTAGTGSEATQGAVISDDHTHEKTIVGGNGMLPLAAALDPGLMTGLPARITAATGMDALTHAVEAYLSVIERNDNQALALSAIRLIFKHLPAVIEHSSDLDHRYAMAYASYLAGKAINQVNVGNVHAIAHQLGAYFRIPHGEANALVLPHMLELYRQHSVESLETLARTLDFHCSSELIQHIRALADIIGLEPTNESISADRFDDIIARAIAEGDGYFVPHLMSTDEVRALLQRISG